MYVMTRHVSRRQLLELVPSLGASILIAEFFYKFHSFTLECIAFLATWYLFDGFGRLIGRIFRGTSRKA